MYLGLVIILETAWMSYFSRVRDSLGESLMTNLALCPDSILCFSESISHQFFPST